MSIPPFPNPCIHKRLHSKSSSQFTSRSRLKLGAVLRTRLSESLPLLLQLDHKRMLPTLQLPLLFRGLLFASQKCVQDNRIGNRIRILRLQLQRLLQRRLSFGIPLQMKLGNSLCNKRRSRCRRRGLSQLFEDIERLLILLTALPNKSVQPLTNHSPENRGKQQNIPHASQSSSQPN